MLGTGQPALQFCARPAQADDETTIEPPTPAGWGTYFSTQLVMFTVAGVQVYWSNLQTDYR